MSDSSKYTVSGTCSYKNFAANLAQNTIPIGSIGSLGGYDWEIKILQREDGDIYPYLECDNDDPNIEHSVSGFFKILNINNSLDYYESVGCMVLNHLEVMPGPVIQISEILDVENGWLDEKGAFNVEFGIRVDAIAHRKIWHFNIHDIDRDWHEKKNTMHFKFGNRFQFCPRVLFVFHSEPFSKFQHGNGIFDLSEYWDFLSFERFIQTAHGVRRNDWPLLQILNIACKYGFMNVIRLCEQQLIEDVYRHKLKYTHIMNYFKCAMRTRMRHLLCHLLEHEHCSEPSVVLDWISRNVNLEDVKGREIKILVKKFLYSGL